MTNNKISNIISSQAPAFVKADHEQFITFLEHYYKFNEQANNTLRFGGVVERTKSLLDYIDIDRTHDDTAEILYERFLKFIPKSALANKSLLVKHILDFYRAKGTEKGLKFLLRIILGKEVERIYYPKRDILRGSDGKWFIRKSLRVESILYDSVEDASYTTMELFISRQATGVVSGATATVESVNRFFDQGRQINELFLSNIRGTFDEGESVSTAFTDINGVDHTLSATIFAGVVLSIAVINGGLNYSVGDPVVIDSPVSGGSGATGLVSRVSSGNIANVRVVYGGAGFQIGNPILLVGGGGSGANIAVSNVDNSGLYHTNTYNLYTSTIAIEANTQIGNAVYSNLIAANANTTLANSLSYFTFTNLGPVTDVSVISGGNNYISIPSYDTQANTILREMGILARMNIANAGTEYRVGDIIKFTNTMTGSGFGANGVITSVDTGSSNLITGVAFTANVGWALGGYGYQQDDLPTTSITTANGSGAVIDVLAILGDGESYTINTAAIGRIETISVVDEGSGYSESPTVNLSSYGDGTAQAAATILTSGVFTYPGYYLTDDGHLSSYNFLQNRDFYQNYSYVIRIRESLINYLQAVEELSTPAGMKVFAEYISEDNTIAMSITPVEDNTFVIEPSLDLNFTLNQGYRYTEPDVIVAANTLITTTRASTAYADNVDGVWGPFGPGAPRITNKGLLVEEARTNSIRNNSMQGAAAGTPGTIPTNWATGLAGLTQTIVGVGTEKGVDYLDYRFSGTASGASYLVLLFDATTAIAASASQIWTSSIFLSMVGGSQSNISSIQFNDYEYDAATVFLRNSTAICAVTSALTRFSKPWTTGASTAFVRPGIFLYVTAAGAVDITIRIGWPQLELGAFVTSPIRTTSAAATRAADVIVVTSPPAFGSAWTLYVEGYQPALVTGGRIVQVDDGTNLQLVNNNGANFRNLFTASGGVTQADMTAGTPVAGVNAKLASGAEANNFAFVANGGAPVTDVSGAVLTPTVFHIGSSTAGAQSWNGYIRHVTYFPARFTNAQLQALTA